MGGWEIVVVEETPSLADAVTDLLRADGLPVETVTDGANALDAWARERGHAPSILVCASNGHRCDTARRWFRGEIAVRDLVIVGSRDPGLQSAGHLHVVKLPLIPSKFLDLIHSLSDQGPTVHAPAEHALT